MNHETIAIIDYGSQYTQLIARRIRELNVYSIILPHDFQESYINLKNIKCIILSGGPSSVYDKKSPKLNKNILSYNIPILGICYGLQLLVEEFGGSVNNSSIGEYGPSNIDIVSNDYLFEGIPPNINAWMSHGDRIDTMPNDWQVTSYSQNGIISSIENHTYNIFGVQKTLLMKL